MNQNLILSIALPLLAVSHTLPAAFNFGRGKEKEKEKEKCQSEPPAPCNVDSCCTTYCLGPENYGVNAAVRPRNCNGDFFIHVAGFYWNSHIDGMEYAVDSYVQNTSQATRNSLIDAEYKTPDFEWNFGFKIGVGYISPCDGWDFGVLWTRYKGKANTHVEAENDDNHTLLPLWSNYAIANGIPIFATDIQTHWGLDLNLIDLELGREFWSSRCLTLRPFIGLRIAFIEQNFHIQHKGGTWSATTPTLNNEVDMDNDYKGVGIRGGLNSVWNFGCGWALYGNAAFSVIYGRFSVDQDEWNRDAVSPFSKTTIMEIENHFRSSRFIADMGLGIQWSALICECKYGVTAQLGWEQHLFFDQNQLWRIVKGEGSTGGNFFNIYNERRGDLDTQGWTLSFKFDF